MCPCSVLWQPPEFHPGLKPFSHYFFFCLLFPTLQLQSSHPKHHPPHTSFYSGHGLIHKTDKWNAVMKASSLAEATVSVQDLKPLNANLKYPKSSWTKLWQKKMFLGRVRSQMVALCKQSSRGIYWVYWMKRVCGKWKLIYRFKIFLNSNCCAELWKGKIW